VKRTVLPRPEKNRSKPVLRPMVALYTRFAAGQAVEVVQGDLKGTRGRVVKQLDPQRWVVQLQGLPAGVLLSVAEVSLRICLPPRG
jgi:transcription antitermination factor NusG